MTTKEKYVIANTELRKLERSLDKYGERKEYFTLSPYIFKKGWFVKNDKDTTRFNNILERYNLVLKIIEELGRQIKQEDKIELENELFGGIKPEDKNISNQEVEELIKELESEIGQ